MSYFLPLKVRASASERDMATTGDSVSTEAQGRQPTRRERAYLPAQLPDDFLCVEATRSTRHREQRQ